MDKRSLATATLAAAIGLALGAPVTAAQAQQKADKPMTKEQKMAMERMAIDSGVHFAFAWLAFNPQSEIVRHLP